MNFVDWIVASNQRPRLVDVICDQQHDVSSSNAMNSTYAEDYTGSLCVVTSLLRYATKSKSVVDTDDGRIGYKRNSGTASSF